MLVKQDVANREDGNDYLASALYCAGCGVAITPEVYAKRFNPFKYSVSFCFCCYSIRSINSQYIAYTYNTCTLLLLLLDDETG